jgi:hypothetical protein
VPLAGLRYIARGVHIAVPDFFIVYLETMRQHGGTVLYRCEPVLAEDFLDKSLVSQISLDADQVLVPVFILDKVKADAAITCREHPALQNSAKEPCATRDQYGLQNRYLPAV